jgi:hypothetical protein
MKNTAFSQALFWVWVIEIAVSGFNYFFLMNRIYQPKFGELKAHQIGMIVRIVYIFGFAAGLLYFAKIDTYASFLFAGLLWMSLVLAFEWIGSLLIRRPVSEILIGWHLENGYMWPYVLLAYLLSPLLVGSIFFRAN